MTMETEASDKSGESRWVTIKYWLSIAGMVLALLLLLLMMMDGTVLNFRCSFVEFITFECNRWGSLGGS